MTTPQILGAIILLLIAVLAFGGAWAARLRAENREQLDELVQQDLQMESLNGTPNSGFVAAQFRRDLMGVVGERDRALARCRDKEAEIQELWSFVRESAVLRVGAFTPTPGKPASPTSVRDALEQDQETLFDVTKCQSPTVVDAGPLPRLPDSFNSYAEFRAAKNPKATVNE